MRNVTVKYTKKDPRSGYIIYRRRVPKALKSWGSQAEFVKTLGRTPQEAMTFPRSRRTPFVKLWSSEQTPPTQRAKPSKRFPRTSGIPA